MRLTGRVLPILVVAVLAATAAGAAAELAPIASEPIQSQVSGLGPAETYDASGNLSIPEGAVKARFEVDWEVPSSESDELTFSVCPETCAHNPAYTQTTGDPPLTWATPLPDADAIGWNGEPTEPVPQGVNLTGTVVFLGPAHHQGHPGEEATATDQPFAGDESFPVEADTVAAAAGIATALAGIAYALRRWLPGSLLGLFSRIPDDELLDNGTRRAIYDLVEAEPGIHFSEIARRLDLSNGRLAHHLDKLLDAELIVERKTGHHRCFSLPGQLAPEVSKTLDAIKSPGARRVLEATLEGAASIQAVAEQADVAMSTASYHVDRLESEGLLAAEKRGRKLSVEPTELARRVHAVLPSP